MAEDEEREAAASAGAPCGAPAPDFTPAEPTRGAAVPPTSCDNAAGPSQESPSAARRDDNPFSLRHFLKRDRSQPGGTAYERTGARPKTYGAASPPSCDPERRYRRCAGDLGMPSLPDFVQDHILVEQAYLDSAGTIDLDNLPDFTAFERGGAGDGACARRDTGSDGPHLNLDLTESVSPHDRRAPSPTAVGTSVRSHHTFPLDLPPPADSGGECPRLPDFLPANPGRASPDPSPSHSRQVHRLQSHLHNARSELCEERARCSRLEREVAAVRATADALRSELREARASEAALSRRLHDDDVYTASLHAAAERVDSNLNQTASRATDAESSVASLKAEIKRLKEDLLSAREEASALRGRQHGAARTLRSATDAAELSLRELLSGLDALRSVSCKLEPP